MGSSLSLGLGLAFTAGDLGQFHNLAEPLFSPVCIVVVVIFTLQVVKVRNDVG